MNHIQIKSELIEQLIDISTEAGDAILGFYNSKIDVQVKSDSSPLTKADLESNSIIVKRLKSLTPDIPILSEEEADISFDVRSKWNEYWLIDPLDGTKEFINKNGEFTVNIALIKNNKPVLGIIHIPVKKQTFWGIKDEGSYMMHDNCDPIKISVSKKTEGKIRIITSRSHPNKGLEKILNNIKDYEIIKKGSSIKFCLIATGDADIYPRLGPTSEWDTAAGEAIAMYAGGSMKKVDGSLMTYNKKKNLKNENFIVAKNEELVDLFLSLIS
jgi:3'(2'), 5'-bisphosphate nucleotidase